MLCLICFIDRVRFEAFRLYTFVKFFPHCFWLVHFFLWNFHTEFPFFQIRYFLITAVLASISVSNVDPFISSSSHSLNSVLSHMCLLFCLILPAWPKYGDLSCHSFCFPRSSGLSDSCSESVGVQLCLQRFESYWFWIFFVFLQFHKCLQFSAMMVSWTWSSTKRKNPCVVCLL